MRHTVADFRGYVTAAGQQFEALAKQMNYPVTIGLVEIGDGRLPDDQSPIARTKLVNKLKEFPAIVEQDLKNPGQFVVTCYIPADDSINGNGYFIREMGCRLIGQGAGVLYSYRRVSDDWKPVISSGEAKSYIYKLRFIPTHGELITPTIDPSIVLVDKEELERRFLKHAAEEDAHSQYAKKANVPVALDNLQKIAAALGNNPNYAADIAVELLSKLVKNKNGSDIPDKEIFRANIGLKSAALKDVGNGASQIPDMSFFESTKDRIYRFPNGIWVQFCMFQSTGTGEKLVRTPVPFPNRILHVSASYMSGMGDTGSNYSVCNYSLKSADSFTYRNFNVMGAEVGSGHTMSFMVWGD
ncbi:hypothetical protein HLP44_000686 [Shigella sonnei]|nr:hypothetical protein [Shigella sonnei]EFV9547720.1 hypothetical protein [Shigella sonnei]